MCGGDIVNILVVDSDQDTIEMVCSWLQYRGHKVHYCYSADKARVAWLERKPDVAIVDVETPGVNLLRMLDELRPQHDGMILAMSEEPSANLEAFCLESGADAFVAKPFLPKLLVAHLNALSRRMRDTVQRQPASVFTVGPIRLDASRNEVRVNGQDHHLTPIQSRILQKLAMNAGDVCPLQQIVSYAWGYGEDGDTYLIKAHIRNLREKVEPEPSEPRYIITVPGVGYMLTAGTSVKAQDEAPARTAAEVERAVLDSDGARDAGEVDGVDGVDDEDEEGGDTPRAGRNGRQVVTGFAAHVTTRARGHR